MRFLIVSVCAVALILVVSSPAVCTADDPGPPNSIIPTHLMLVGETGAVSDPLGAFEIFVRDFANNPVPGAHLHFDFFLAPDVRLSVVSSPGWTVLCGPRQVQAITDAQGVVRGAIRGGSRVGPASLINVVKIYADGVLLGTLPVSTPDLDGLNGVGATDLAMWLQDFLSTTNPTRSDFSHDGFVGAGDLAIWLQIFFAGGSTVSTPTCP